MEDACLWDEDAHMGSPSSKISSAFYGDPITRKLVQEFNTNTTNDFAKVIISPKTDGSYTMKMAFESGPFMFAFTFCLAGAAALTVLSVFILFRRLMVDDKYVASKTRVNVIIIGYIFCILLCISATVVIIIGLTGLHQGIKLVLRNQTELSTVVSECSKLLYCELDPAKKHVNEEMDKYFTKIMRTLPFLKEEIKTLLKFFDYLHNIRLGIMKIHSQCKYLKPLFKEANEVVLKSYALGWQSRIQSQHSGEKFLFWSNLKNANTSFNEILLYGTEAKRLADDVEKRSLTIKESLNKFSKQFVKSSCEIMEDTNNFKKQVDSYVEWNEPSIRMEFRLPWLFLAIIVMFVICICGMVIVILRHHHFLGDSQSNPQHQHRVLFAVFDLTMEVAGHLTLYIAILAFLAACYVLYTAYSPEFLCVGVFNENSLAMLNALHEYYVENATDANIFNDTFIDCFANKSMYDSFVARRWIFTEEFDNMFYSVNLDPYRDRLNEIDVSFLIPQYEKFYDFMKKNIEGKNISYFTCGTDRKAKDSLAKGKWNITLPGIFKTTPQVIQLMKDLPKIRRKFFQDSTALNDFHAIKSEGRKYLMNHVSSNSPPCMLATAWNNDGFGWCHVIPLALERVFIGCVLIALAAMLLTKFSFDTVDFIPFVPPSAQEVAMTKSEVNLLTAEPLRLMPSLTNVSLLGNVNAKELAKRKDREKPTQEIHSDSREDFVPPTKGEPAQESEKVKKPVQRRSVYSNDARTARLPVRPPPKPKRTKPRPGQEDVTMDDDEVDVLLPASPLKKEPDEPRLIRRSATGMAVIAPQEKPPPSPQDPVHISSNYV